MQWNDLAKSVIGLGAPALGTALAGPLGGAAGAILAQALGVPEATPAAVREGMEKPSAHAQVSDAVHAAEANWRAAVAEAGRAQVTEVGQTMRAEAASSDPLQRCWRPLYALELTLFECPGFAAVLGHALWNGRAEAINGLATLSGLIITYIAARFGVLGVYVSGRSREKQMALAGAAAPALVTEVVKALAKRTLP